MFEEADIHEPSSYRRIIGRLLYLVNTRPDICFAVQHLSQFVQKPTIHHHRVVQHVLRYIKVAPAQGLFYSKNFVLHLKAFSDSDWASCSMTRRSTTGFCIFLEESLISWKTKKQSTVSRSSSEAEYRALASTSCQLQWLTFLLRDLHVITPNSACLYCDSQAARHIALNSSFHECTKHIDIDCHVVHERLQQNLFHLLPIRSVEQPADVLSSRAKHFPETYQQAWSSLHTCSSLREGFKFELLGLYPSYGLCS